MCKKKERGERNEEMTIYSWGFARICFFLPSVLLGRTCGVRLGGRGGIRMPGHQVGTRVVPVLVLVLVPVLGWGGGSRGNLANNTIIVVIFICKCSFACVELLNTKTPLSET